MISTSSLEGLSKSTMPFSHNRPCLLGTLCGAGNLGKIWSASG